MADNYKIHGVKISFDAPYIRDIDTEKWGKKNFQWFKWGLKFSKGDKYYTYQTDLMPWGGRKEGQPEIKVVDSGGEPIKGEIPDISASDIERNISIAKKPEIEPNKINKGGIQEITYLNSNPKDPQPQYGAKEFFDTFVKNKDESGRLYYLLQTKGAQLVDPFGKNPQGKDPVEKSEEEVPPPPEELEEKTAMTIFQRAVRNVREKAAYSSGGFDIMKKFVKREREKQKKRKKQKV